MNRLQIRSTLAQTLAVAALIVFAGCGRPSDSIKGSTSADSEKLASKGGPPEPNRIRENKGEPAKEPTDPSSASKPPAIPKAPEFNPKAFAIEKTGSGEWRKSSLKPGELAARIGNAIRGMAATQGEAVSSIKTPSEAGQVKSSIKVRDDKMYSIQLLHLSNMPALIEVRADGTKKAETNTEGGFGKPKPLGSSGTEASLKGRQLVERWPTDFAKLSFLGLTDGKDAWQPYLSELLSGKSGFTGEIAERTKQFRGRKWLSYRVTARRTAEAAKKLGPCEIEMVFDGDRYLPVTIRVNRTEPKGGNWNVLWQAGWNFNKKFDAKEFALPAS